MAALMASLAERIGCRGLSGNFAWCSGRRGRGITGILPLVGWLGMNGNLPVIILAFLPLDLSGYDEWEFAGDYCR